MNSNCSTIEKQYFSKSCNPLAEGQLNASYKKHQKRHFLLFVVERNGVCVTEKVHFVQHFTLIGSDFSQQSRPSYSHPLLLVTL